MDSTRFTVHRASPSPEAVTPGVVAAFNGQAILGLQGGSLAIEVIQPAGKGPMPGRAWLNGRRGTGGRLDPAPE